MHCAELKRGLGFRAWGLGEFRDWGFRGPVTKTHSTDDPKPENFKANILRSTSGSLQAVVAVVLP